jgi:hypothetical protein
VCSCNHQAACLFTAPGPATATVSAGRSKPNPSLSASPPQETTRQRQHAPAHCPTPLPAVLPHLRLCLPLCGCAGGGDPRAAHQRVQGSRGAGGRARFLRVCAGVGVSVWVRGCGCCVCVAGLLPQARGWSRQRHDPHAVTHGLLLGCKPFQLGCCMHPPTTIHLPRQRAPFPPHTHTPHISHPTPNPAVLHDPEAAAGRVAEPATRSHLGLCTVSCWAGLSRWAVQALPCRPAVRRRRSWAQPAGQALRSPAAPTPEHSAAQLLTPSGPPLPPPRQTV